jgi:hypothetical protein
MRAFSVFRLLFSVEIGKKREKTVSFDGKRKTEKQRY